MNTHRLVRRVAAVTALTVSFLSLGPMGLAVAGSFPGINGRIMYIDTNNYAGGYNPISMKNDGTDGSSLGTPTVSRRYASYSADGTKIVYTKLDSGIYQVHIMSADGTNDVALTSGSDQHAEPSFSPDGTKILYSRGSGSFYQLYTMNVDGSNQAQLLSVATNCYNGMYSPDGTKILYEAAEGGGDFEVLTINSDGTGKVNLTNNSQHDIDPAWSPDGTKIIYSTLPSGDYEIMTMNADGSNPVALTADSVHQFHPRYSPDGTKIAFAQGSSPSEVYTMKADGTNSAQLTTNGWVAELDWQPLTIEPTATSDASPTIVSTNSAAVTVNVPSLFSDSYGGINNASVSVTGASSDMEYSVNATTGIITITPHFELAATHESPLTKLNGLIFAKAHAASSGTVSYQVCSVASSSLCSTGTITVVLGATANAASDLTKTGSGGVGVVMFAGTLLVIVALWVGLLSRRRDEKI